MNNYNLVLASLNRLKKDYPYGIKKDKILKYIFCVNKGVIEEVDRLFIRDVAIKGLKVKENDYKIISLQDEITSKAEYYIFFGESKKFKNLKNIIHAQEIDVVRSSNEMKKEFWEQIKYLS